MSAWPSIRRTLWLAASVCLLLTRFASAGEATLAADFDGDGHHDRVVLDGAQPSVLRIWLSATNATAEIHSHTPIVRVVARDLDGDRRPELIAGSGSGLQVWTRRHHSFRAFKPHGHIDADMARPGHRAFDDGPVESRAAIQWIGGPLASVVGSAQPRAPDTDPTLPPSATAPRPRSSAPLPRFAPRPPPALA